MDKLIQAAEKAQTELDVLCGAATPDAEAVRGKTAELDGILVKIETTKANAKRRALIADAKKGEEVAVPGGKDAAPLADPARATDHEADLRAKEDGFFAVMLGGKISDSLTDALLPKSKSFEGTAAGAYKDDHGKDVPFGRGFLMPERLKMRIFGTKTADAMGWSGKAIPMGGGVPSGGGPFSTITGGTSGTVQTVPHDFRSMLLELGPEPAAVFPLCTIVPAPYGSVDWPILRQSDPNSTGSNVGDGNEFGGVIGGWIQEGAAKPSTAMLIDQLNIKTFEYAAYTELTNRLMSRSAIQLEPLLTRLFRDKILDAYDRAILTGNGLTMPQGIETPDPVTGLAYCRWVSRNLSGQFGYVDMVNLEMNVLPYHRAGCIYVQNDGATRLLKLAQSTSGFPLWMAGVQTGFMASQSKEMNGYPYISTLRLPALGSKGDVLFGKFSEYIVAMEEEVVVQRSEHYAFNRNVTAFRVSTVIGGKNSQPRAFTALDATIGSTTKAIDYTTGPGTTTAPAG